MHIRRTYVVSEVKTNKCNFNALKPPILLEDFQENPVK